MIDQIGIVVIGRNEGQRLQRCMQSIIKSTNKVVYVDSGSTDNSVNFARSIGISVIELDLSTPFTAGRARNEGFQALVNFFDDIEYIQFIDGDCELGPDWLNMAWSFLNDNEDYAIATGRRKELYPNKSVYNLLCDFEWNTPLGDAGDMGGDFFIRLERFKEVKGFNPQVIAGEDSELCYRIRMKGHGVMRLDVLMTYHDAAMTTFMQWWKRSVRSGHAYGQCYILHKNDKSGFRKENVRKILIWSLIFPFVIGSSVVLNSDVLFFLLLYPLRQIKIFYYLNKRFRNIKESVIYSFFIVLATWPEFFGILILMKRVIKKNGFTIIEYK